MAIPVEMPKMSDTMEEGVLVAWLADEGDAVSAGDVIAQVETDKATMDLEVYDDGVLLKKVIDEGEAVPIGSLIAVLGEAGEDVEELLAKYGRGGDGAAAGARQASPAAPEVEALPSGDGARRPAPSPQPVTAGGDGRVKASPLARKLAGDHGIDLTAIAGSGPQGRIIKRDVEAALSEEPAAPAPAAPAPAAPAPAAPATVAPAAPEVEVPRPVEVMPASEEELYEAVRISQMRKTIARRLAQSKFTAPHFYLTVDVAMEKAIAFREQLNELAAAQDRAKVSFNDLITKACGLALRVHPWVNSAFLEEAGEIRKYHRVHVGVAVAVDEGLVTPVIRDADRKGLAQIAEETRALAVRARERKLQPEEMAGSTFTTSNLGMFGIEEFTAIINPPSACILAIGAIRDVPVVRGDEVVPGKRMKLTLSCDHRVVDGATGAAFLGSLQRYLEDPLTMLL